MTEKTPPLLSRENLFSSPWTVVVGTQWGDEGKGRIVDYLCSAVAGAVRYQGGHNAGHTIVIEGKTYQLSLLPSAVAYEDKTLMLGTGVVIDPRALMREIHSLEAVGLSIRNRLFIARSCALILPLHSHLDGFREERATHPIGTTRRGIGAAYEDKVARRAVRVCDLRDDKLLKERLANLLEHHNPLRLGHGKKPLTLKQLWDFLDPYRPHLLRFSADIQHMLLAAWEKKTPLLFEGAQGTMLDLDSGSYPYVTSSHTLAGSIYTGAPLPPSVTPSVLGVTKAYTTRVGEGPFPTEIPSHHPVAQHLFHKGEERGSVTNRPRRCGWLDGVILKYASKINGLDGLVLTKLDVLDGLETIEIAVDYNLHEISEQHISYKTFAGWQNNTEDITQKQKLPPQARAYIDFIEEFCNVPIKYVCTGPQRNAIIQW